MVNVLLTCAGRRNYLVRWFREALGGRGSVIACDASEHAAALHEADRGVVVPPVDAPHYVEALLEVCRQHEVRLLCPLNDLELPVLASQRERFVAIGTVPVVSSPEVVELCFDKWATARWLSELGVAVPRTYVTLEDATAALARGEASFPLVVKPRWGSASIGLDYPESLEEIQLAWRLGKLRLRRSVLRAASVRDPDRALLAQERLRGDEYGLDVVNDLDGNHVATLVRRKLAMRAGETDRAVTVEHERLAAVGRTIGESLRHVGNLDVDAFVDGERCWVLELNPRFGGGYPFCHAAGARLPAALIAWAMGEPVAPEWLAVRPGVASAKCDRLVTMAGHVG